MYTYYPLCYNTTMNTPHKPGLSTTRIAADVVIMTIDGDALKVLTVVRRTPPFAGVQALPGGFLREGETSEAAALRILRDKAHVTDIFFEQLYTFDAPNRDPRGPVASVVHWTLVPAEALAAHSPTGDLVDITRTNHLAFDHAAIVAYARARLRAKLAYSNIAYSLLPSDFTLGELQHVYEVIFGRDIDKRNFRKKLASLDLVEPTGTKRTGGKHRPALLYRFKNTSLTELDEPAF